jgi:6-phosphofructokinase 2
VRDVCRFYKQIAEMAKTSNSKLIIDTSGDPLRKALEAGVYMIKPNVGELAKWWRGTPGDGGG